MVITCERCGNELTGKAKRWCSKTCSKLGLKSLYRKRKLAEINKYKNDWRRAKNGGNRPIKNAAKYRDWETDRKSTRLNSSHITRSRMPSSA